MDYENKIKELEKQLLDEKTEHNKTRDLLNRSNAKGLALKEDNLLIQDLPQELRVQKAKMKLELQQAATFTASGAFPKCTPEQAYVLMRSGDEMGLKPLQALNALYIVNGQVNFYGKALINRVIGAGYKVDYTDESAEGVTVTVTGENFKEVEVVKRTDPVFDNSKAIKIDARNKMRYHGVRMIVNFYLPNLVSSCGAFDAGDFTEDVEHQDVTVAPEQKAQNITFENADENKVTVLPKTERKF